jgi:hypothetical protein
LASRVETMKVIVLAMHVNADVQYAGHRCLLSEQVRAFWRPLARRVVLSAR